MNNEEAINSIYNYNMLFNNINENSTDEDVKFNTSLISDFDLQNFDPKRYKYYTNLLKMFNNDQETFKKLLNKYNSIKDLKENEKIIIRKINDYISKLKDAKQQGGGGSNATMDALDKIKRDYNQVTLIKFEINSLINNIKKTLIEKTPNNKNEDTFESISSGKKLKVAIDIINQKLEEFFNYSNKISLLSFEEYEKSSLIINEIKSAIKKFKDEINDFKEAIKEYNYNFAIDISNERDKLNIAKMTINTQISGLKQLSKSAPENTTGNAEKDTSNRKTFKEMGNIVIALNAQKQKKTSGGDTKYKTFITALSEQDSNCNANAQKSCFGSEVFLLMMKEGGDTIAKFATQIATKADILVRKTEQLINSAYKAIENIKKEKELEKIGLNSIFLPLDENNEKEIKKEEDELKKENIRKGERERGREGESELKKEEDKLKKEEAKSTETPTIAELSVMNLEVKIESLEQLKNMIHLHMKNFKQDMKDEIYIEKVKTSHNGSTNTTSSYYILSFISTKYHSDDAKNNLLHINRKLIETDNVVNIMLKSMSENIKGNLTEDIVKKISDLYITSKKKLNTIIDENNEKYKLIINDIIWKDIILPYNIIEDDIKITYDNVLKYLNDKKNEMECTLSDNNNKVWKHLELTYKNVHDHSSDDAITWLNNINEYYDKIYKAKINKKNFIFKKTNDIIDNNIETNDIDNAIAESNKSLLAIKEAEKQIKINVKNILNDENFKKAKELANNKREADEKKSKGLFGFLNKSAKKEIINEKEENEKRNKKLHNNYTIFIYYVFELKKIIDYLCSNSNYELNNNSIKLKNENDDPKSIILLNELNKLLKLFDTNKKEFLNDYINNVDITLEKIEGMFKHILNQISSCQEQLKPNDTIYDGLSSSIQLRNILILEYILNNLKKMGCVFDNDKLTLKFENEFNHSPNAKNTLNDINNIFNETILNKDNFENNEVSTELKKKVYMIINDILWNKPKNLIDFEQYKEKDDHEIDKQKVADKAAVPADTQTFYSRFLKRNAPAQAPPALAAASVTAAPAGSAPAVSAAGSAPADKAAAAAPAVTAAAAAPAAPAGPAPADKAAAKAAAAKAAADANATAAVEAAKAAQTKEEEKIEGIQQKFGTDLTTTLGDIFLKITGGSLNKKKNQKKQKHKKQEGGEGPDDRYSDDILKAQYLDTQRYNKIDDDSIINEFRKQLDKNKKGVVSIKTDNKIEQLSNDIDVYNASSSKEKERNVQNIIKRIRDFENDPKNPLEELALTFDDRIVFIIATFFIRYVTIIMVQWCIDINIIKSFYEGFIYYAIIYIILFWFIVLFINIDNSYDVKYMNFNGIINSIRTLFYYFYMGTNGISRLLIHTSLIIILIVIPIILNIKKKPNFQEEDEKDTNKILDYEERMQLSKSLSLFTMFIWLFTSIIATKF